MGAFVQRELQALEIANRLGISRVVEKPRVVEFFNYTRNPKSVGNWLMWYRADRAMCS